MPAQQMLLGAGPTADVGRIGKAHGITDLTASQTVIMEWNSTWTHDNTPVTDGSSSMNWMNVAGNCGAFFSGVAIITADFSDITTAWFYNVPTLKASWLNGTDGLKPNTTSAPQGSAGGYAASAAKDFSKNTGAWMEYNDSRTLQADFNNLTITNGPPYALVIQGYGDTSHSVMVLKVTINSIARMYMPHHAINQSTGVYGQQGRSIVMYPMDAASNSFSYISNYAGSNNTIGASAFDDWA